MESSLKAPWWMWWANPLVQMHSDQKKRFYVQTVQQEQVSYAEIQSLRGTLGLSLIPEDGVITAPFYGMIVMCEPTDLLESKQKLPSLSFEDSVLKLNQSEWEQQFQVSDKDHIRALITFCRTIPEELQPLIKKMVAACSDQRRVGKLSLQERTQVVLSVFMAYKFPAFSRRWFLNLSDAVLYVIDQIGDLDAQTARSFCNLVDPEILSLIEQIKQRHAVPELDFKTLADYEAEESS